MITTIKLFGVNIRFHWSTILLFSFLMFFVPPMAGLYAALVTIVILHEFGHILVGKYFDWSCDEILIYPIGGFASMVQSFKNDPVEDLFVTIAGPFVNVLLIYPLYLLDNPLLFKVNLIIMFFNLCTPCFPMDSGRIVRSLIEIYCKDRVEATDITVQISKGVAVLMFIVGIYYSLLYLPIIAWVSVKMGYQEYDFEYCLKYFPQDFLDHAKDRLTEKQIANLEILVQKCNTQGSPSIPN